METRRKDRLTFVLPLRGERDILAARLNLLPSIDRLFRVGDIHEILVLARTQDHPDLDFSGDVSDRLARRIVLVDEDTLLPPHRSILPLKGYDRQQVLKLTVSRRVRTAVYCTLDSDVYVVTPCGVEDWYQGGRCVWNREHMDWHPRWWRAASRQLGVRLPDRRDHAFGVTPALLHTDVAARLVEHLEARKGLPHAIRRGATEYSLYWLYLLHHHGSHELYRDGGPDFVGNGLWKADDVGPDGLQAFLDRQFEPDGGYFMSVLQSTSGLADRGALEAVRERIEAAGDRREGADVDSGDARS